MNRKAIAQETLAILERGAYTTLTGRNVSIADPLRACIEATNAYLPEELSEVENAVLAEATRFNETIFSVANKTTLEAARRLTEEETYGRVGVLNFASARNPGGGFLGGAQAQEESLARSSGLYPSLSQCPEHYDFHRNHRSCLYSDRMIYSPGCPIFRQDNGNPLDAPYCVDILTSPAPNAGAIRRNEPDQMWRVPGVLRERSAKVLSLAAAQGCEALILGAWGCGCFRNDPILVADVFARHLLPGGAFWARFRTVVFAVLDNSPDLAILTPFVERFGACESARDAAQ